MLFGNFRQPLIIFLILPLSLIGMVFGLLLTGFQFGFFCIAGWLGLLGMIIKNVIVLLDEVNVQRRAGIAPYTAVIEATVSGTSCTDGCTDNCFRKYPAFIRCRIWWHGSNNRIRLVVCHTAYIICDSGSICYFLQNIVSIAFSRNLCGTFS